jgi:glycosyltransferase involved in cell wall biosynthesis
LTSSTSQRIVITLESRHCTLSLDFSGFVVRLLLVPPHYPHPAAEWVGSPNEHSALALNEVVQHLEILTPRPYAPRVVGLNDRWKAYSRIPREHIRGGIRVHRPVYPVVPKVLQGLWPSRVAFLCSRRLARRLHHQIRFDAILSFDLAITGGLAWRLGADLGIPACGWATGSDIRANPRGPIARNVREALRRLDLVFYQSGELKALAGRLLGTRTEDLPPDRHVVQARGVREPDAYPGVEVRGLVRSRLGVADDHILILYLGRIVRGKGLFELVDAFADCAGRRTNLVLLLVGSIPGFDHAAELQEKIRSVPAVDGRIQILPACGHDRIWDYFAAADIFAFPSFKEGMPNSLLEAMLAGLPAVAFSISSVQEITRFGKALLEVPAHDFRSFADALLKLADDPSLRKVLGEQGRAKTRQHFSATSNMRAVVDRISRVVMSRCASAT